MVYAPIVITTLCRDQHLYRELISLANNSWAKYTDVYVIVDYPASEKHVEGHSLICAMLDAFDRSSFNHFTVVKRSSNYGVWRNGREAIDTLIVPKYDRWIFAEDDLEFSPNFIEYMDRCLEAYAYDDSILAVCGYSYPLEWRLDEESSVFLTQATYSAWGVGRWRDKQLEVQERIEKDHFLLKKADRAFSEKVIDRMIEGRRAEYVSYAALGIGASMMERCTDMALGAYLALSGSKVIVPAISKVRNNGFDGSGTWCSPIVADGGQDSRSFNYSKQEIDLQRHFEIKMDNSEVNSRVNHEKIDMFLSVPERVRRDAALGLFIYRYFGLIGCALARRMYLTARRVYLKIKGWR